MTVKLQQRKLKTGLTSLYLEYYREYSKDKSGKIQHKRVKENLELYLIDTPKNAGERLKNKEKISDEYKFKRLDIVGFCNTRIKICELLLAK
jgi:hypothetical protein